MVVLQSDALRISWCLHEYGHCSGRSHQRLRPIYAYHNGCVATINGSVVNSPNMPGWRASPITLLRQYALGPQPGCSHRLGCHDLPVDHGGTTTACPTCRPVFSPETVELYVAGALWDLIDAPGDIGDGRTTRWHATMCRCFKSSTGELDRPGVYPTIKRVSRCVARPRLPRDGLRSIWLWHGFSFDEPLLVSCSFGPDCIGANRAMHGRGQLSGTGTATAVSSATVVCTPPQRSSFPGGVTVTSCTATDAGQQAACSFRGDRAGGWVAALPQTEPAFYGVTTTTSI